MNNKSAIHKNKTNSLFDIAVNSIVNNFDVKITSKFSCMPHIQKKLYNEFVFKDIQNRATLYDYKEDISVLVANFSGRRRLKKYRVQMVALETGLAKLNLNTVRKSKYPEKSNRFKILSTQGYTTSY